MAAPQLKYIPLDKIRGNPVALRDVNKQGEEFLELVNSVRRDGVMSAISVRYKPDAADNKEYELVDGLQRFSAACEAGTGVVDKAEGGTRGIFDERPDSKGPPVGVIPAQVVTREDADALVGQIIANAHKIETKPVEYAKALMRFLGYNPTMTESQLAATLSKSPQWISKMLGLVKLHDQIQPLVNENRMTVANAFVLAKLPPDEQLNWLERAQTMDANQFSSAALARVKEIKDANKQGRDAGEEKFVPVAHLRKKPEIEIESTKPEVLPALIRDLGVVRGIKASTEGLVQAAILGAQLGLSWALNMDPKSVEGAKLKYEERKKKDNESKIRRDAEKKDKKEKEAAERADKAKKEAEEARKKAAELPPIEVTATEAAPVAV